MPAAPHLPPGTACHACGLTAADWTAPDEKGVRWTCRDIRPHGPMGRPTCARCRLAARRQADASPSAPRP